MRTLVVAGIGLVLAFGFVYAAKMMGKGTVAGAIAFLAVWLIFCANDFSRGVSAGYSALDELGIHLVLFAVAGFGAWAAARWLA